MKFNDDVNVVELAMAVYQYICKQFTLLFLFMLVGLLVGVGMYFLKEPKFSTEMLASSPVMSNRMTDIFNNLAPMVKERQYKALARQLQAPLSMTSRLVAINCQRSEIEAKKAEGSELLSFKVYVTVKDTSIVPELQAALISFIEHNDFVARKIELRRELLTRLIAKIDEEITELDNLQLQALESRTNQPLQFNLGSTSQLDLVALLTEKNRLVEILEETRPINVIQPFGMFSIEKSSLIVLMAAFGFVFLVLGMITSLFLELRKLAKQAA